MPRIVKQPKAGRFGPRIGGTSTVHHPSSNHGEQPHASFAAWRPAKRDGGFALICCFLIIAPFLLCVSAPLRSFDGRLRVGLGTSERQSRRPPSLKLRRDRRGHPHSNAPAVSAREWPSPRVFARSGWNMVGEIHGAMQHADLLLDTVFDAEKDDRAPYARHPAVGTEVFAGTSVCRLIQDFLKT